MRALPVVFSFAATAASQATWVVDDNAGPGVHFTSLPAAVAAAASGDTLLVGPGSYAPFQVAGKALTIRGAGTFVTVIDQAPAPAATEYVTIDAVPAGAVFRLSALGVRRAHPQRLVLRGNGPSAGTVVMDNVHSDGAGGSQSDGPSLWLRGLPVHAHRCTFDGGTTITGTSSWSGHVGVIADSNATFVADACTIRGGGGAALVGSAYVSGATGLVADGATCRLSACTVRGGDVIGGGMFGLATSGSGVEAVGAAVVTIAGAAADVVAGGSTSAPYYLLGYGIRCSPPATVAVHGGVTISGGVNGTVSAPPTTGSTITLGLPSLPRLRFSGSALANGALPALQPMTLSLDVAPPGELFVLLADLRPGVSALPGLSAEPLLLAGTAAIAAVGLLDGSGAHTQTAVPATQLPYVVGLATHWQAFVWQPPLGRWTGSNATVLRVEP